MADGTHPESLHDLAQCYEKKGGCPVLIADEHYAFELYARAAQFGFAPSQYRLGSCYEYGLLGCQVEAGASIKWYSKAAEQGFPDAELALSSWYLSGAHGILPQSDTDAFLWARKAAERKCVKAEYQMGNYYEIGIGVESDGEEAMLWYSRAAANGHKRAAQRLAELRKNNKKKTSKCIIL
jgi:TPR repeat protein